jgi:hypothetical protein
MDGSISIDSIIPQPAITSTRSTARRVTAARTARDLKDVRLLKVRVSSVTALAGDLIDWGAGNHTRVGELEAVLHYPLLQFTARERKDIKSEIESCSILESACRAELANVPAWAEVANRLSWKDLADIAAQRAEESATGRLRPAR